MTQAELKKTIAFTSPNANNNKFEWTLDNIRIEKIISAPIWATKYIYIIYTYIYVCMYLYTYIYIYIYIYIG